MNQKTSADLLQNINDVLSINIFGQTFEIKLWVILMIVAAVIILLIATILTKKKKQGQVKTKVTNFR